MEAAPRSSVVAVCPRCDAPRTADQRYCLDCGLPLPATRGPTPAFRRFWMRRLGWYPGDWALAGLVALVVAAGGAAGAVALSQRKTHGGSTFAASTPPAAPAVKRRTGTTAAATRRPGTSPQAPIAWPPGSSGWTVVLVSLPRSAGPHAAAARAA